VRHVDDAEERLTDAGVANGTRVAPTDSILVVVRSMALANGLQIGLVRRPVAFNQDIKAILPAAGVHPRFLYFALWGHHDALHGLVDEASHGTKRLRTEVLGDYRIAVPPLAEQERIAAVLSALDDKIDSNRRLAVILENTTAALFRAQFVDFVGLEEFDESDIGRLPRGWSLGALVDLARFVNGRAFTQYANGQGRPILRIRELSAGVDHQTPQSDVEAGDDCIARFDDILFAWSGSLGVYRWSGEDSLINQHIFKVVPSHWPAWYVFAWIQQHMETFRAIARDKAPTMGHIQRRHLAEARLPLPTAEAISQADSVVGPLNRQRAALVRESRTLGFVRDDLLPKLISGHIRVPDTEDLAEVIGPVADGLGVVA
jgi:type I restriction enzyme S subunit